MTEQKWLVEIILEEETNDDEEEGYERAYMLDEKKQMYRTSQIESKNRHLKSTVELGRS